jgi:hypothetical protein
LELVRHLDNYIQEEEIRLKQLKRWGMNWFLKLPKYF